MEVNTKKETIGKVGEIILYEGRKFDLQNLKSIVTDYIVKKRNENAAINFTNIEEKQKVSDDNPLK